MCDSIEEIIDNMTSKIVVIHSLKKGVELDRNKGYFHKDIVDNILKYSNKIEYVTISNKIGRAKMFKFYVEDSFILFLLPLIKGINGEFYSIKFSIHRKNRDAFIKLFPGLRIESRMDEYRIFVKNNRSSNRIKLVLKSFHSNKVNKINK